MQSKGVHGGIPVGRGFSPPERYQPRIAARLMPASHRPRRLPFGACGRTMEATAIVVRKQYFADREELR
jgi:hypothetical protein